MKKLLLASAAALPLFSWDGSAADLPGGPAYPAQVPYFSWTGFYVGGNVGGAWAQDNVTDGFFGLNFNNGSNSGVFIGGGQLGFNYQIRNIVLGAEWDFDWAANNNNSGNGILVPNVGRLQVSANDNWISTLAARFGVACDRWLIYGKAGAGWVGTNNFTVTNLTNGISVSGANNNGNSGWLVGAGVEWAFWNNWSAKIEYDYLGLSGRTFTSPGLILPGDTFTSNPNIQMVKFGVNYRFGWDNWGPPRY